MSETITPTHQLPAGTVLSNKYEIIRTLGEGGFGITYMGRNKVLDIPVAIKEYYPHGYANRSATYDLVVTITDTTKNSYFAKWKDKFLNEARTLAKFSNIPNIVNVLDFFEQNGTAYIVMEYLNGTTLSDYVSRNGVFNADSLCQIMIPMLRSLNKIHQKKLIHRDISPDNIMVMPDGSLKLFDFGAARDYSKTTQRSLSVMLKPGYAPEEQYRSRGIQGPWTDVYAACATMYFCITGLKPDDSIQRVFSDELKPPSELGISISPLIEDAILMGMSVKSEDRFRTAEALATAFERGLSVSEQPAPSKSAVKLLRRHPRTNKKTNPRDNHTEIAHTELEKPAENTEKKTKYPGILSKFATSLNKRIIIEVLSGLAACGIMLTIVISSVNAPESPAVSDEKSNDPIYGLSVMSDIESRTNSLLSSLSVNSFASTSVSIPESSSSGKYEVSIPDFSTKDESKPDSSREDSIPTSSAEDTTAIGLCGTWNGTTYISNFFGFKCELGSDWYIMPDEYFASIYAVSDISEESIRAVLSSTGSVTIMGAINSINSGNFTVAVTDTQITHTPTGDTYFMLAPNNLKKVLEKTYGTDVEVTIINVDFCGETTRAIATITKTDDITNYQIQVPVFNGDYMGSIIFTATTRQVAEELIRSFSKL